MIDLTGARVVLTGAGGGVGRALCATLGRLGAQVVSCDIPGTDLASEAHHFDLRDRDATLAAASAILAGGTPSVVISNAGWTRADTLDQCTPDVVEDEMTRNFTGAAHFTQAFLPAMRAEAGNRAFVFVCSVNALTHHGNPPYSAAKAAVLNLTNFLAREWATSGVRVNSITPGFFPAEQNLRLLFNPDGSTTPRAAAILGHTPMARFGEAEELSGAVIFLASPNASSFVTGTDIRIDGGFLSQTI
jgi:NAD(P)-dependent dehydrogenase (short-subunit alcohol dehydrogenase family)